MDIAVISFHHSESSVVLAKYLAEFNKVHYYYVTDRSKKSITGVGFLSKKNFKVGLNHISLKENHPLYRYLKNDNLKISVIAYPTFRSSFKRINQFLTRIFLKGVKKNHYDVVNIIGQLDLLVSFYKPLARYKIVHSLHEVANHYEGQKLKLDLLQLLYQKQIPIIVHSKNSFERLMAQFPFDPAKVLTVPFGLFETYQFFSTGSVVEDEKTILFYGFLKPYKGLATFINAIRYARNVIPDIKAIVAGAGDDPALELIADDPSFELINRFLDSEEIVAFNEKASIIVCPYTSASQSGIITTSFVFNKPIIASDIGGFKEIITNNVNGYLVPVGDYEAIGKDIIKLLSNRMLLNECKANIKILFESGEFSWPDIVDKTIAFYKS